MNVLHHERLLSGNFWPNFSCAQFLAHNWGRQIGNQKAAERPKEQERERVAGFSWALFNQLSLSLLHPNSDTLGPTCLAVNGCCVRPNDEAKAKGASALSNGPFSAWVWPGKLAVELPGQKFKFRFEFRLALLSFGLGSRL